eukprot:CAMPEP_0206134986 /NCGR_PEP_ID=MMETSP1473-20131121/367_1 /ASSEMBLY_ACC=CAM_ASM_001109 /TAXON_ID=1461547 /ORGANISM="Stichococcus sp, Strain RCC1054" /LENGTH=96 /DNA_ID=CAMNT_0053526661 /DNA_START=218 /DNA_END=508 /DNA_ORIENTATION=-
MSAYKAVSFEVFGKVQGVFFRASTVEEANRLGVVGWCRNTRNGTVEGEAQGVADQLESMKDWLQHTGSPASKIERVAFKTQRDLEKLEYTAFEQRR